MKMTRLSSSISLVAMIVNSCSNDKLKDTSEQKYYHQVKAIITEKCLSCHASGGSWSGRPIQLDTDQDITSQSEAIKKSVADPVAPGNRRMPKEGSLTTGQIQTIVNWHQKGGRITD